MLRLLLVVLIGIAVSDFANANEVVIPGGFSVSESGASSYSIEIAVPPGTAGLQPSLSLNYSSQSGNGLLGVGWTLSGLSTVTRCPKTIAQDGVRGAVNFDTDDRFCIDGQRLVGTSGTYGASGSDYRTEMEGFSRIRSYSFHGTGPAIFDVWTKSGLQFAYGGTWPSRTVPAGQNITAAWKVNSILDRHGNYMNVGYGQSTANSFFYPTRIDYTGTATNAPFASVRFTYESRTDIARTYHQGSLFQTNLRLKTIDTYVGNFLASSYTLTYEYAPDTDRSRLVAIEKCDGTSVCLPKTSFTYPVVTTDRFSTISNVAGQDGQWNGSIPLLGDFDGDGRADVLWHYADIYGRSSAPATRAIWLSNGDGTVQTIGNVNGQDGQFAQWAPSAGDFNGDGLADILWMGSGTYGHSDSNLAIWLSDGDGTFTQVNTSVIGGSPASPALNGHLLSAGDFNGDGKTDLFFNHSDIYGRTAGAATRTLLLSSGDGTFQVINNVNSQDGQFVQYAPSVGDFDGDGLADILWMDSGTLGHSNSNLILWLSDGDGTFTQVNTSANGGSPAPPALNGHLRFAGDFNGDGKTDLLFNYSDVYGRTAGVATRVLLLSKGDGTFHVINNVNGQDGQLVQFIPTVADLNGDGFADVHWVNTDTYGRTSGNHILWISKGDGTFDQEATMLGGPPGTVPYTTLAGSMRQYGDFNGDGKSDMLWYNAGTYGHSIDKRELWLSTSGVPDLLSSIDDGFGPKVQLTYTPLTDDAIYTRGSGAVYPEIDLQPAAYVVSRADVRDGVGGFVPTEYRYGGLRARADGRGSLGFAWTEAEQVETDFVTRREYRQDYPYVGRVSLERSSAPGVGNAGVLSEKTYAFACINPANASACTIAVGNRYFPYATTIVEKGWDLDGSVLPVVTTTNAYDAWGNATEIAVSTSDGFSKTTTNTYTNNEAAWILGRLTRTSVTDVSP